MGTFSLWHLLIVIGLIGGGVIFILNTNRLFSSGFKKEGSTPSADYSKLKSAEDTETILHAYEHVRGGEIWVNRHIRELPYDKETIKKAIKDALLIEPDKKNRPILQRLTANSRSSKTRRNVWRVGSASTMPLSKNSNNSRKKCARRPAVKRSRRSTVTRSIT